MVIVSYDHQKDNPLSPWLPIDHSLRNETGKWALTRPKVDQTKCIKCLRCWISCPESAIEYNIEEIKVDLFFCKGCGICDVECPTKAIVMESKE